MKIHLTSDIHLEFTDEFPEPPVADVGIFAGDIGNVCDPKRLIKFFESMKARYEHVIWVMGNHEFYHLDYDRALTEARQIAQIVDVHLLDINLCTENLTLDGVTFWGSTMWTDFNNNDWFVKRAIKEGIRDFTAIKVNNRTISVTEVERINKMTRDAINWDADVIITHHSPVYYPHPNIPLSDLSWAFYNNGLKDQIADSNVKLWLFGHTHASTEIDLNGTKLVSNCHGFKSRYSVSEDSNYNPDLIIEI